MSDMRRNERRDGISVDATVDDAFSQGFNPCGVLFLSIWLLAGDEAREKSIKHKC